MSCRLVSAKPESCISIQVSGEERSGGGELLADQPQPDQPCSHCEFRIFRLLWFRTCCFQFFRHFGKGKAKLNVTFQLSCVKSVFLFSCRLVKLEKSEFDCSLCKGGMEVQHMVSAVVVVLVSAVICTVRRIPDVCKLCHVGGLFSVQLFDELGIDRSAISVHSALVDFQGVRNQPFVARHKVGEVSQGLRCVSVCSNVNVYSGSDACMADCSGFAKLSDQFL